jgi:uncharacterized protein YkwD
LKTLLLLIGLSFILSFPSTLAANDRAALGPADPEIRELARLINSRRESIGCPELRWDDRAAALAGEHSRDMVERNFFSHTNPDGKDPFDRMRQAGIGFNRAGENMVLGVETGREVYQIWLHSPGHRNNMLDCRFTRQGIGRAGDRWTQVLFRP